MREVARLLRVKMPTFGRLVVKCVFACECDDHASHSQADLEYINFVSLVLLGSLFS